MSYTYMYPIVTTIPYSYAYRNAYCCISNLSISLKKSDLSKISSARIQSMQFYLQIPLVWLWFALISLTHKFCVHCFIASIATSFLRNEQWMKMGLDRNEFDGECNTNMKKHIILAQCIEYMIYDQIVWHKKDLYSRKYWTGAKRRQARNWSLFVWCTFIIFATSDMIYLRDCSDFMSLRNFVILRDKLKMLGQWRIPIFKYEIVIIVMYLKCVEKMVNLFNISAKNVL